MTLDFYSIPASPPCAVVSLVISSLGIESEVKYHRVNMAANEQLRPEYLKINPQHTAPTIVDDGFALWESRAIIKYLASKYNSKLYPEDLKKRALVDQRLDFDLGTLYSRFGDYYFAPFYGDAADDKKKFASLQEALGFFNTFLESTKYAAGSDLTVADFSLAIAITMMGAANISIEKYPNIVRWHALVKKTIPKYEEKTAKYVKEFIEFFDLLSKKLNLK